MYQDILTNSGLSEKEAQTYEKMLEVGPTSVGALLKALPYKRGDMYNIVQGLCDKGLAREELKNGVLTYTLENPEKLSILIIAEQEKAKNALMQTTAAVPQLQSLYNLSLKRPGVRFYEGEAGIWNVLNDTLTSKTELLFFGDNEAIEKYIPDVDETYVRKRKQHSIKKRLIMFDVPSARAFANTCDALTDVRLIGASESDIRSIMHIYDNKVSYVTFLENIMIGVLIEDTALYQLHRTLFEFIWNVAYLPPLVLMAHPKN